MARPGLAWRKLWWRVPLVVVLGLAALLVALPYALETPWLREQLRVQVNSALKPLFQGQIAIDRIGHVGLWGVRGVDARVFDAKGQQVIRVQGLTAIASLPSLGWQLATNSAEPELTIDWVHIDHADVALREDEELGVTLAAAFLPREEEQPVPPSSDPGPRLRVEAVSVDRVWAHGRVSGSPPLDAELLELRASLSQSSANGFALELERVELLTRGLPLGADPRGKVTGRIDVPQDEPRPMRLEATLQGRAAGSPLELEASWVGDALFAHVSLPQLPAAFLNERVPGLALQGEVALVADVDGELPQLDFQADIDAAAAHLRASGYAVVSEGLELVASLEAARVDLAGIAAGAPPSDLNLRLQGALFEQDEGSFVGSQRLEVAPGVVAAQATPALWLAGKLQLDEQSSLNASGRLGVAEPGAPITGDYDVALPSRGPGKLAVSLRGQLAEPARLAALGVRTSGTLAVDAALALAPDDPQLSAKAELSLVRVDYRELSARNVELRARASGSLEAPQLQLASTLDLLSGRAHADLEHSAAKTSLHLFAADIDLLRLAQSFGTRLPLRQGMLGLDLAVERRAPSPTFELNGSAAVDLGQVGAVRAQARDFQLPSSVPTLAGVGALRGDVTVSGNLDLSHVQPLLTASQLPIERTTGKVRFELGARHRKGDQQGLELAMLVETAGLRVVQQRAVAAKLETTSDAVADAPLALEGIDLRLSARVQPAQGEAVGTLILRDSGGTLAELQAEALLAGVWPNGLTDPAKLAQLPLKATLQVPTRRLGSLPPLLRPPVMRGRLSVDATLDGSVAAPNVSALVSIQALRASGSKAPLDVQSKLTFSPAAGRIEARASVAKTGAQVLDLSADWQGDLRRAAELVDGGKPVLSGSATVELDEFPLDVVPDLVDRQVIGRLSGKLALKDWGKDARVDAALRSSSLSVSKMAIQELKVSAKSDAAKLRAELALTSAGGQARASLDAAMSWGGRVAPELQRQGVAKVSTRGFRLETLTPLIGSYVSELGGVLDADMEIGVTPTSTTLRGEAKLDRGVVQVPAIGQRFSDISARVAVRDNQFKLDRLVASGTTGRISVTGGARMDGFALQSAEARATILEREKLPITLEGQVLGDAWGNVNVTFKNPPQGARQLLIDVPRLQLIAPQNSGSGLQSLDEPEGVRVGVRRSDGKFVPLAVQPLDPGGKGEAEAEPGRPLEIAIKLGDIGIEQGRAVKAQLTGQLAVATATETRVTGRIEVRGGKLDVQGKTFEIERGVITFDGKDPGNPTVTATARWDAPEYTVYADYVGDVETGRIKLRAEPPLTQDEIASLLLFGSPEGSAGGNDPSAASLAVSVAGGTATQGLNQALDDFTNLDVSARIDTTTGSARPELVFQVSPRVAAKVTRAIGSPAAGESPDRTFLTLELRLRRAWALSALIGDRGASALDLIWRRRY